MDLNINLLLYGVKENCYQNEKPCEFNEKERDVDENLCIKTSSLKPIKKYGDDERCKDSYYCCYQNVLHCNKNILHCLHNIISSFHGFFNGIVFRNRKLFCHSYKMFAKNSIAKNFSFAE